MKQKIQHFVNVLLLGTASLISTNASASLSNEQLLDVLLENGAITQAQYQNLSKLAKEEEKVSKKDLKNEVEVSLKGGHFKIKSTDGAFSMGIGGRMMMDSSFFADNSVDINGDEYGNGSELHRFRIHMKGKVFHDWKYQFAYDFGGSGTIKDAWISYVGLEELLDLSIPLIITVGNDKEPLGLEYINSSKYLTFLERGLTQTFAPERALGVSVRSHGELAGGAWTTWAGWYGNDVNKNSKRPNGDKAFGSQAFAGRITYAPIVSKTEILHFGGSVEQRHYSNNNTVTFKPRPEDHLVNNFINYFNKINVDNTTKFGLEASGVYGPFALQGEYFRTNIDVADSSQSLDMDAWYIFTSWFITGESRRYKTHEGAFTRVKPNTLFGRGGWGAFEVAYRFSYLDMGGTVVGNGTTARPQYSGSRQYNSTIGLNWYPTSTLKFMANYVWAHASGGALTKGYNLSPAHNYNAFTLRAQIDF